MANYQKAQKRITRQAPSELKEALLGLLRQGNTITEALKVIERSRSWYEGERRKDRDWADLVDKVRTHVQNPDTRTAQVGEYAEFAETYLGMKVWPHQQNMIDLLEGKAPSWLHPAMTYEPGSAGFRRLLINIPPNFAKSMTITTNYVTYRIAKNPNINVILVSKTQESAKKFLYAIKQRLSHPRYADLQLAFGPADGFKATADQWSATKIYLGSESRDSDAKDPTVEAIGMGGQIYGARAHLIVLDDVVTLANSAEWSKQMDWIRQEVASRLGPDGQLLVVGTRVASMDLYRALRDPDHYADGVVPWTYLAMPAVLEQSEDPADWVTLWPKSEQSSSELDSPDEDGFYPRWTGPRMAVVRNEVGPMKWSMVYQQQDVEEQSTFDAVCVRGSVNGMRKAGPLIAGAAGHPMNGDGFYRILSMDPAIAGDMAVTAYAVDRTNGKRYVLDVLVKSAPKPQEIRDVIKNWTQLYNANEWVIEDNAFQGFLAQDEEIRNFLAIRGIRMISHHTGSNKTDPDFGVASMQNLFGSISKGDQSKGIRHNKDNIVELPDPASSNGVKTLIEQLLVWSPLVKTKHRKQDAVMSLWFAEIRARDLIASHSLYARNHAKNPFLTPWDRQQQSTVNLYSVETKWNQLGA